MNKLILSIPVFLFFAAQGQINPKPPSEKPSQSTPPVSQSPAVNRNTPQLSISDFGAIGAVFLRQPLRERRKTRYVGEHERALPQRPIIGRTGYFIFGNVLRQKGRQRFIQAVEMLEHFGNCAEIGQAFEQRRRDEAGQVFMKA